MNTYPLQQSDAISDEPIVLDPQDPEFTLDADQGPSSDPASPSASLVRPEVDNPAVARPLPPLSVQGRPRGAGHGHERSDDAGGSRRDLEALAQDAAQVHPVGEAAGLQPGGIAHLPVAASGCRAAARPDVAGDAAGDQRVHRPADGPRRVNRHTSMPPRVQRTPHGEVSLRSRWYRGHYLLVAYGATAAVRWLFPSCQNFEVIGSNARHTFEPSPQPITVERELRRTCACWQQRWDERLGEQDDDATGQGQPAVAIQSLGQLFDHLHAERAQTLAQITSDRDRYKLRLFREELGDGLPLRSISVSLLASALARIGNRVSPRTANAAFAVVKTYLTWAGHHGLLRDQSHLNVRRLRCPPRSSVCRDWWTSEEVHLAIRCSQEDHHQPTSTLLVACGCYLGLRPEELIMLRWQDLDLDAVDPVTRQPQPVCHVTAHDGWMPKDGEERHIPVRSSLLAILRPHRKHSGYLLNPEPGRKGRPRGGGKGLDYRYYPSKLWARLMKRVVAAGGRAITLYGMRHSFASNLLIANASDVKVARWLGHSDTRMLHRHYGHLLSYDDDINSEEKCAEARAEGELDSTERDWDRRTA